MRLPVFLLALLVALAVASRVPSSSYQPANYISDDLSEPTLTETHLVRPSSNPSASKATLKADQTTIRATSGTCKPDDISVVEIALVYDRTICERFDFDQAALDVYVDDIIKDAARIFSLNTCVKLRMQQRYSSCAALKDPSHRDAYAEPSDLDECSGVDATCTGSRKILRKVRRSWLGKPSQVGRYDIVLFLSGYDDRSSVCGAAYANSVCDHNYGFAWIEGTHPTEEIVATLSHEISHLLGAGHTAKGLMREAISPGEKYVLSEWSVSQIKDFIADDPRAWCLSRVSNDDKQIWDEQDWFALPLRQVEAIPVDLAVAHGPSFASRDVYFLTAHSRRIWYWIASGVQCIDEQDCFQDAPAQVVEHVVPSCAGCEFGSISLRSHEDREVVDVIVSYMFSNGVGGDGGAYFVGHGQEDPNDGVDYWGEAQRVPNWDLRHSGPGYIMGKPKFVTIATGAISASDATDLVWMYIDERKGRKVVRYKVGYDLDSDGAAQGGWSEAIWVPGWFGYAPTSIRAALYNVDDKGTLDLVVFHQDASNRAKSTYYRVGRNVNATGHVTGGWSSFKRIPNYDATSKSMHNPPHVISGIDVTRFEAGKPTVVVSHLRKEAGGEVVELVFNDRTMAGLLYKAPKFYTADRDVSQRCYDCFSGYEIDECVEEVKVCAAWLDEVRIENDTILDEALPAQVPMMTRTVVESSMREEEKSALISCEGFRYLYKLAHEDKRGCQLADYHKVMGFGVLEAFKIVLEQIAEGELSFEEVDLDVPVEAGTSTAMSTPTAVSMKIRSSRDELAEKIHDTVRIMMRKYTDYGQVFKPRPQVRPLKNRWYRVKFLMKTNHRRGEF